MADRDRPNILLLFTDQHALSAVGCYGTTPCQTPQIDRLARQGVRFETAYTVFPVCSPARATIMTGLYPHAHGVCSNVHDLGASVHELRDRPSLLSRRLQAAGYRCGYTGKWHLGTDRPLAFGGQSTPSLPRDVGFEGQDFPGHGGGGFGYPEYQAYLAERGYEHRVKRVDSRPVQAFPYGVLGGPVESTVPYYLAEHTIGLIDRFAASGRPFFIWHNNWGPHSPYYAPLEFYDLYREVTIPEWPNYRWPAREINRPHQVKLHPYAEQFEWEDWAEAIRHYYAFTTLIDAQFGRILDHLDRTGLRDNTVVLFTADHGETLGTHGGLYDKGWHHFEEIQRIPFVVWVPDHLRGDTIEPGDVLSQWVSNLDVYPSLLEWAGVPVSPGEAHGLSIAPVLAGQEVPWRERVCVEFSGVNSLATSMVTLRDGDWKFGWNCSNWDELYNLAEDPYEMHDLSREPAYAPKLTEMQQMLAAWMEETHYPGRLTYRRSRLGTFWGNAR